MSPLGVGTSRSIQALETGEAKLWILLVGVNQYQDESLPALRYSALDCQGLAEALADATQEFPNKKVIIHHNFAAQAPTLETIRGSLKQIVSEAKSQDTILFYFSGHGVLEPNTQQAILCLADTFKDDLATTGIGLQELLQMLGNCAAHQQLVWLDACHSGDLTLRGARGNTADPTLLNPTPQLVKVLRQRAAKSKGFYALLSCDQAQQSWEFPELGHGLFTYYLMRGLRGEAADPQGVLEADGLYKYVYHQTLQYIEKANQQLRLINQQKRSRGEVALHSEYPLQTPKRIVEGIGELILGLRPERVESQHPRQALIVEGLSGSQTTRSLTQVLREAGSFELEYWPGPGKAWPEVRKAIQDCLRWRSGSEPEVLPSTPSSQETATLLLYLRGRIQESVEGEAQLLLGNGIQLSRSWLRQELRRSGVAQQIVVLDCPGASSLADWVEDLQLRPEQGQCLIAAAAPAKQPELFAQALLETLISADQQVGLPVAEWIAQLQLNLAGSGINLHVWLSGIQGVIEVLPARIGLVPWAWEKLEPSGAIIPASLPVEAPVSYLGLSPQESAEFEALLAGFVGPIAPTLVQQALAHVSSTKELIEELTLHLAPQQQMAFEQRAISLLQELTVQPQAKSGSSPSLRSSEINQAFVHQCEQDLADLIGPIATLVVEQALASHPHISATELVANLAAEIPDRQKASEFNLRLLCML
ncbi:High-affinity carbon uptake protein Hat/HatR [uncultured Synechococcales cyanobacterium]|uniref:High-affinity carbon uptake protein Hat/HatR n=1 Tax=uncultured Synechococcales cyanobacterium TaxID=1936017 RepID=A0A6J4VQJ9_9CYAN|nr:High-affinity carbon uptake protein Hat/HatR [uncultured Synechococcales cyanobacterium]